MNTWWFYAILSAVFAALTAILAKIGIEGMDSELATAIRTVFILIIAWAIAWGRNSLPGLATLSKQNLIFLALSGAATGLSWIFYFHALKIGKVSQVAPIDKLSVALTLLLSVIILKETVSWYTAIGAALIIAGTIVIIVFK